MITAITVITAITAITSTTKRPAHIISLSEALSLRMMGLYTSLAKALALASN